MQPKLEPQMQQMPIQIPSSAVNSIGSVNGGSNGLQMPPPNSNPPSQQPPTPNTPSSVPPSNDFRLPPPAQSPNGLQYQQQQQIMYQQQAPQQQPPNGFYQQTPGSQPPTPTPPQAQQMPMQMNNNFNNTPQPQQIQQQQQQQQMILNQQQQQQYQNMNQICTQCNTPIRDRYLLQCLDRYWHVQCLKCQACKAILSEKGEKCFTRNQLILCREDYIKMFGGECIGGMCDACAQPILGNQHVMRANSSVYHVECFSCQKCRNKLKTGDKFVYSGGRIFCEKDNPMLLANGGTVIGVPNQAAIVSTTAPSGTSKRGANGTGTKRGKNTTAKAAAAAQAQAQAQQQQQQQMAAMHQQKQQQMMQQQNYMAQQQQQMQQMQQQQQQQLMYQEPDQSQQMQQMQLQQQLIG